MNSIQKPGQLYTFKHKSTGDTATHRLPEKYGDDNEFVYWHTKSSYKNGGLLGF